MKRNIFFVLGLTFIFFFTSCKQAGKKLEKPSFITPVIENQIEKISQFEPDAGIIIALIDGESIEFYSQGKVSKDGEELVDKNSIFEIGSSTKVFTALLIMHAIEEGSMSLDDPVKKFLPKTVTMPKRGTQLGVCEFGWCGFFKIYCI